MDQNSNEKERILRLAAELLREPDQEEEEGGIDYAGDIDGFTKFTISLLYFSFSVC